MLHFVVAASRNIGVVTSLSIAAADIGMSILLDSLLNKLYLCACLGTLIVEREILEKGMHNMKRESKLQRA